MGCPPIERLTDFPCEPVDPQPSSACVVFRLVLSPAQARLPPSPRQPSIISVNPLERHRDQLLVVGPVPQRLARTLATQRDHIDLPPLVPARIGLTTSIITITTITPTIDIKELLDRDTLGKPPVPADQAAIASPMPETPAQAHALVPAEDDLAAHLADGEVEECAVARVAGQPGVAADDPTWCSTGALGPPAKGAKEGFRVR
ncbi:hypothetical protein VPNG_00789 [Cytospora leucostoma]|uniref:Uncharacterized protein n=1 Tax=Cytospora leucostoma TaxID=1230097 RepID=A0A423XNQ1_9PEZI|nr:hypothetical protein VPNG_00789 [Cytospora leucostoma]